MGKYLRILHRDLSFFFAGVILIYAISGITMNHYKGFNARYTIGQKNLTIQGDYPRTPESYSQKDLLNILDALGEKRNYTRHYSPDSKTIKVFMKEGSSLTIHTQNGKALYESIKKRPVVSGFVSLHYNSGKWWTYFSDIFAISLIIIVVTGLFLTRGKKGLWGTGGIKLLAGILIPVLFLFL